MFLQSVSVFPLVLSFFHLFYSFCSFASSPCLPADLSSFLASSAPQPLHCIAAAAALDVEQLLNKKIATGTTDVCVSVRMCWKCVSECGANPVPLLCCLLLLSLCAEPTAPFHAFCCLEGNQLSRLVPMNLYYFPILFLFCSCRRGLGVRVDGWRDGSSSANYLHWKRTLGESICLLPCGTTPHQLASLPSESLIGKSFDVSSLLLCFPLLACCFIVIDIGERLETLLPLLLLLKPFTWSLNVNHFTTVVFPAPYQNHHCLSPSSAPPPTSTSLQPPPASAQLMQLAIQFQFHNLNKPRLETTDPLRSFQCHYLVAVRRILVVFYTLSRYCFH